MLTVKDLHSLPESMRKQILQKVPEAKGNLKNKYGAQKTEVGGRTFDSKKEADRYIQLLAMQKAGEIENLEMQVKYELIPEQKKPNGDKERACDYVCDFQYIRKGKLVVEDVKGYRGAGSPAYRIFVIKRKLMLARYGIYVREV